MARVDGGTHGRRTAGGTWEGLPRRIPLASFASSAPPRAASRLMVEGLQALPLGRGQTGPPKCSLTHQLLHPPPPAASESPPEFSSCPWRMLTLQAGLLFLLLVNQATTDTSVVSTEGQGPPGPQSCSPGEYWIVGRCCKACPAGQHAGEHCRRSHSRGQCVPCPPGTFMNCLNGMEACSKCSAYSKNEEVLEECTPARDLVCPCPSGYFYEGSSESCRPCSTCPAGHVVVRSCNATADTVCRLPAPGKSHPFFSL
ncbi:tumor necrosis factor receptor superfamily member 10A-like [Oryx dammah]|uniref:tumor necrosis factor receptor superfamily member 10A-like n=1 Tax=Oryx dammah TaxID=59534 RepID=UPI001A9A7912|nr:tumor necrosis factor receptor superfamily member 10A-like [Oryx dammah]